MKKKASKQELRNMFRSPTLTCSYVCAQDLCIRQAQILNTKSSLVEEAANELINMLLEFEPGQRDEEEKAEVESSAEGKAVERNDSEGMPASFFLASGGGGGGGEGGGRCDVDSSRLSDEDEGRSEGRLFSRNTLLPPASVGPSSPLVRRRKKKDLMAVMEEEAKELLSYFNHRNVDALLRLTRNTLEMLRRRINAPSAMHFAGEKLRR